MQQAQQIYSNEVLALPKSEQLRLATLILEGLAETAAATLVVGRRHARRGRILREIRGRDPRRGVIVAKPGDIVIVDFPGVQGVKRRPAVVVSSDLYHQVRPDVIVGLLTSQVSSAIGPTDYVLRDWQKAKLRVESAFRSFFVTLPQWAVTANVGHATQRDWQGILACVQAAMAS
jgi:PemK-like, MazF-like toxin of type II toxin-antitoxin system